MRWRHATRTFCLAVVATLAGACAMTTTYQSYDDPPADADDLLGRRIDYYADRALYTAPPDCVVVLPAEKDASARLASLVEPALARHLGGRFPRVRASLAAAMGQRRHGWGWARPGEYSPRRVGRGALHT